MLLVLVIAPADVPARNSPEPVIKSAKLPLGLSVLFLHLSLKEIAWGVWSESLNQAETIN